MVFSKPFHRNVRGMKESPNSGYSGWAYINDRDYANSPMRYVRAFHMIQSDLISIFEYVEPSEISEKAFSFRIHELLLRTCVEIEANFKAILLENKYEAATVRRLDMRDYRKVEITHHLSSYRVKLPTWHPEEKIFSPFSAWSRIRTDNDFDNTNLPWYQAYNKSKHDRHKEFSAANLGHLIEAVCGLLVLLTSQFRDCDFTAGSTLLSINTGAEYHDMDSAIGSYFRIQYPNDWCNHELYDFNWSELKNEDHRFEKFDYDAI